MIAADCFVLLLATNVEAFPFPLSGDRTNIGDAALGSLEDELALGKVEVVAVDADVLVDLTDLTEEEEDIAVCCGGLAVIIGGPKVGRVNKGFGGPLICRVGLAEEGVGLGPSLVRSDTRLPFSAAVGLRALALPGIGAVAGPDTERAERVLATEVVEAELLRRSRRKPGASSRLVVLGPASASALSVVGGILIVEGREDATDTPDAEAADDRTLPASDRDIAREVVLGTPRLGALPVTRLRTKGEIADGPRRSSIEISISAHQLLVEPSSVKRDAPSLISLMTQ